MLVDKIFIKFFTPFVPFIALKTTVSIPRFQRKNRFEKRTTVGREIRKTIFQRGMPNQTTTLFWFFSNISGQGGLFFKPIFALKPWDQDSRFEYNKSHKWSKNVYENFSKNVKNRLKNPKLREN